MMGLRSLQKGQVWVTSSLSLFSINTYSFLGQQIVTFSPFFFFFPDVLLFLFKQLIGSLKRKEKNHFHACQGEPEVSL